MDIDVDQMQKAARRASVFMKALSDEKRLMILCQLAESEKSAGQPAKLVGLAQSPLSQHLAKLPEAGWSKPAARPRQSTIPWSATPRTA